MAPLTFTTGSMDGSTQCLNVTITEDTLVEGDETFSVTLTLTPPEQAVTAENTTTTVTITDNEGS